jgi:hypothetical protein
VNASVTVGRQFTDHRLDLRHKVIAGNGGRPISFCGCSCRRSARFERETPITFVTVFIGNRPSAATAAAAVFFEPVACSSASLRISTSRVLPSSR